MILHNVLFAIILGSLVPFSVILFIECLVYRAGVLALAQQPDGMAQVIHPYAAKRELTARTARFALIGFGINMLESVVNVEGWLSGLADPSIPTDRMLVSMVAVSFIAYPSYAIAWWTQRDPVTKAPAKFSAIAQALSALLLIATPLLALAAHALFPRPS